MNKNNIIKTGNKYNIYDDKEVTILSKLDPLNYIIQKDKFQNMWLEPVESFTHLPRYYDNVEKRANMILDGFRNRPKTTGVLLTGEKGSGKSLLSKYICIEAAKEGIPTILINQSWHGNTDESNDEMADKFNKFIQSIQDPCIILIDEFEKIYNMEKQERLLTLLDGVYETKKLFILTANENHRINNLFYNRPSRIYYHFNFRTLGEEFIEEYCEEHLTNNKYKAMVIKLLKMFSKVNFDMMKSLIEEMNRYPDTHPKEILDYLNVVPFDNSVEVRYYVKLYKDNSLINEDTWWGNPVNFDDMRIEIGSYSKTTKDDKYIVFCSDDMVRADFKNHVFTYLNKKNFKLVLSSAVAKEDNMWEILEKELELSDV